MDKIFLKDGVSIQLDIQEYLERYDLWDRPRWTDDRLICRSPFREDNSPSFFVNFNNQWAGTWGDSGSGESGNFVELVARLDGTTYEEALDKLFDEFYIRPYEVPTLSAKISLNTVPDILPYDKGVVSSYLIGRGISDKTQEAYGVGEADGFVDFPYVDGVGVVRAVKHRSTSKKDFWYDNGNNRINEMLFGYHVVYNEKPSTLFICEAEIDAMTAYEMGYVGVSLGSAHASPEQLELISKTGVNRIVIATDNDKAGNLCANRILNGLSGNTDVYRAILPPNGDLNEFWTTAKRKPPLDLVKKYSKLSRKVWFKQIK